jgi:hypothetical protein
MRTAVKVCLSGALVLAEDEPIDRFPDSAVKPAPAYHMLEHIRSRPAKKRLSERGPPPRTEAQDSQLQPLETLLLKGEACGHKSGDLSLVFMKTRHGKNWEDLRKLDAGDC